jgi:hypothetical protein
MATEHPPQDLIMQATVIQKLAIAVNHNVTELTRTRAGGPIYTVAWLARNLLELFVWTEYCTKSPENAKQFYIDAVRDFDDIVKVIKPEDVEEHPGVKEPLAHFSAARTELAELLDPGELDKQYK